LKAIETQPRPPGIDSICDVLCVDLDGSLIASDMLFESFMGLVRTEPLAALRMPAWLLRGRAHLKRQLAERGRVDVASLPYRIDVVEYLHARKRAGARLVLATAADESFAWAIADHLGIFDDVIASDGVTNLEGSEMREAIQKRFPGGFEYLGNGWEDLAIWKSAAQAIAVRPGSSLLRNIRSIHPDAKVFEAPRRGALALWPRMLRVHQWAKNVLVFVPLIMAHQITQASLVLASLIAFFAFSFSASSIYIINDLIDLPSDRVHHRKRNRPLAAGAVSIPTGLAAAAGLLVLGLSLALSLPSAFLEILILYLVTSSLYTFWLKKKLMIDVLCLAGLYTIRILGGGAATSIEISPWLMAFSMFLFLSLALVKRYAELAEAKSVPDRLPGRGYLPIDMEMVRSVGPASGYLSVLVVCLYLNDPVSSSSYHHPKWLWLLCPILLYWISRVWFLTQRGDMHSDPVVFAISDRISLLCGICCGTVILAASIL
jgi:4-hydroxybenzoate polyprenyltransferase